MPLIKLRGFALGTAVLSKPLPAADIDRATHHCVGARAAVFHVAGVADAKAEDAIDHCLQLGRSNLERLVVVGGDHESPQGGAIPGSDDPPPYGNAIARRLESQAERIMHDFLSVMNAVSASAQLRQAVSNTRLQRAVIVLTIIATIVAVVGLMF